jgi:predicted metal-dependent peptidase
MRQRSIPFSPGTTIFTERPRVLVVLDVSGSHVSQVNQCMAEIDAIARMKGAAVDVITFDDGVQQKFEIKNKSDLRKVLNEGLRGAGGTSLNGVFEDINKMQTPYKACVVMTDGYLSPPTNNTKKISIAWMITAGGNSQGLEDHGEVIYLPDYSAEAASQKKAA